MAIELGSAVGKIEIDSSGVTAGIEAAKRGLQGAQTSLASFGSSAKQAGAGLMSMGAPLVAFGGIAAKVAGDFESQMNILSVAARGGSTSLEDLRNVAITAGQDVRLVGVSAADVAGAMTGFAKAGLNTNQMLGDMQGYLAGTTEMGGALRAAIDLAAASELDLGQASDLVTITMNTFGLSADQVVGAMSNYVQAADASVASVSDLRDAMINIGPTAASFGFSLADVNTALALLSTRGIQGAEAGTALKSMLTNIMRGSKESEQALKDLNITLYDEQGAMRSLPEIISQLQYALNGLTDEQRNAYIQTLAGTYGMKAMNTLLADGEDAWNNMESSIAGAATMQQSAAAQTKGFNAAMENLKSSIETFMITAGTPLIENVFTPLVKILTEVMGKLAKMNPNWIKWAVIIGGVITAVGGFLMIVGQAAAGISAIAGLVGLAGPLFAGLGAAVAAAAAAIGAALAPVLLIVAAVAAVAALLYLAWKNNFLGIRDIVEQLGYAVEAVFAFIKESFAAIGAFLRGDISFEQLVDKVKSAFGDLRDALDEILPNIKATIDKHFGRIRDAAGKIWDKLIESLGPLGQFIDGIRVVFENVFGVIQDALGRIVETIGAFWKLITGKLSWKDFVGELGGIWDTFGDVIDESWTNILAVITRAWEAIKVVIRAAISAVGGIILNGIAEFIAPLVGGMDNAKRIVTEAWENIKTFLAGVWETISTSAAAAWEALKGIIQTAIEALRTVIAVVLAGISGDWGTAWEALKSGVGRVFGEIAETVGRVAETIRTGLAGKWESIRAGAAEKWEAVRAGASEKWESVWTTISGVVGRIRDFVVTTLGELVTAAAGLFGKVLDAIAGRGAGEGAGGAGLGGLLNVEQLRLTITQVVTALQGMQAQIGLIWAGIQLSTTTAWTAIQLFFTTWLLTQQLAFMLWLQNLQLMFALAWATMLANTLAQWEAMRAGAVAAAQALYDQVTVILNQLVSDAYDAGVAFGEQVAEGIYDSIGAAVAAAQALANAVNAVLPHSDAEEGPLSHLTASGRSIPETLAKGMLAGAGVLMQAMNGMLAKPMLPAPAFAAAAPYPASASPAAGNGRGQTQAQAINVTINNPVGEPVETSIVRQLRNLQYVGVLS